VDELSYVLWIGGPPASGKSTVGRRLARRNGLRWYSCDTRTWVHRDRVVAAGHPGVIEWAAMTVAERQAAQDHGRRRDYLTYDRGPMVLDDLRRLPKRPLVVAEGGLATPRISGVGPNTLWLVPPAHVRLPRLRNRGYEPRTIENALREGRHVERQVDEAGGVKLAACAPVEEVVTEVEERFAPLLAAGSRTSDVSERRALLRYGNRWIVKQYKARGWFPRDPATIVKEFDCECAQPDCDAMVDRAIASFPDIGHAQPTILADGHTLD
jgi:hypothetical protein